MDGILESLTPQGNKTQLVRLLDVFVFGPLMILGGREQKSKYFRTASFASKWRGSPCMYSLRWNNSAKRRPMAGIVHADN